jgi:hypothetical protein
MVRFNEDGTLDTSFGSDWKVLTTSTTRALFGIFQLSMTPGGKLLAGGIEYGSNGTTITTLARYDLIETGDSTSPTITPNIQGTLGTNDWYTSDVTLSWTVVDDESAFTSSGCDPVTISTDQQDTSYTCEATSAGGTDSVTIHIKRDVTTPVLSPSVDLNPVLLNGSATASPNASDATSGVASAICGPVITNSVGEHSVTCAATDNAGNTSSSSATYTVTYKFIGFSQPVDNNGVLNIAKAGQAIPLKFRITDANGSPVINLAGITATSVGLACAAGTTTDLIEEYTLGSSGLQNLGDGYYQWNWKTLTTYANSCKTLRLDLGEGLYRTALFQFRK